MVRPAYRTEDGAERYPAYSHQVHFGSGLADGNRMGVAVGVGMAQATTASNTIAKSPVNKVFIQPPDVYLDYPANVTERLIFLIFPITGILFAYSGSPTLTMHCLLSIVRRIPLVRGNYEFGINLCPAE